MEVPFSQIMAAEEMQLYPPPFVACTYRILIVFVHVNHRCFYVISVDFFLAVCDSRRQELETVAACHQTKFLLQSTKHGVTRPIQRKSPWS